VSRLLVTRLPGATRPVSRLPTLPMTRLTALLVTRLAVTWLPTLPMTGVALPTPRLTVTGVAAVTALATPRLTAMATLSTTRLTVPWLTTVLAAPTSVIATPTVLVAPVATPAVATPAVATPVVPAAVLVPVTTPTVATPVATPAVRATPVVLVARVIPATGPAVVAIPVGPAVVPVRVVVAGPVDRTVGAVVLLRPRRRTLPGPPTVRLVFGMFTPALLRAVIPTVVRVALLLAELVADRLADDGVQFPSGNEYVGHLTSPMSRSPPPATEWNVTEARRHFWGAAVNIVGSRRVPKCRRATGESHTANAQSTPILSVGSADYGPVMTPSVGIALAADLVRAVTLDGTEDRVAVAPVVQVPPAGRPVVGGATRQGGGGVYRDFTDRVGDPVPVIGSDGTARLGADLVALTVAGLLAHATQGAPPAHLVIAHPAHWGRYELSVLHSALTTTSAADVPTSLVSAPIAAVTAAESAGSARRDEAVLVADIGGAGTELTLLSAGADRPRQILATSRVEDLGATALDRALARHILAQLGEPFGTLEQADPAHHAALLDLVARCRAARADLGVRPATVVDVALPSRWERVRVIRTELESLIAEPISAVVSAISRMVGESENNGLTVGTVLLTGEPARTPLLTEQLSVRIHARVLVPTDPEWTVAAGAAAMAATRARQPRPPLARTPAAQPPRPRPVPPTEATPAPLTPRSSPTPTPAPPSPRPVPRPTSATPTTATTPTPTVAPTARPTTPPTAATPYRPAAGRGPARIRTAVVSVIAGFAVLLAGGAAVGTMGGGGSHLASGSHSHR